MKICITRSRKSGYTETFIRNQIAGLSQKADVVTLHSGRLPQRTEDGKLVGPWFFWLMNQLVKGITGRRNNFFSHYGLKKFLQKEKVDLVVGNYGLSAAHLVPICADLNIPLVAVFHGFDATSRKVITPYRQAYLRLFTYATAIVAVSNDMKEKLVALGAPREKVSVIPYGIDTSKFTPQDNIKRDHASIVAVGRFTGKKSPLDTIRAFNLVSKSYPSAKLLMIGEKDGLYHQCQQLVDESGLDKVVSFSGRLSPEQISGHLQRAGIFVQHSVTAPNGDMEGTPNSVLEASASALPVVSTLHGGIKEAVVDGVTGYLVAEYDYASMAAKIKLLLEDPASARKMGNAAREHILKNYSLETQTDKLYTLLKESASAYRERGQ